MNILQIASHNNEMQEIIEHKIRPVIQPEIPLHLWGFDFSQGDASISEVLAEAAKIGYVPLSEDDDDIEGTIKLYLLSLDQNLKSAIEDYDWTHWFVAKNVKDKEVSDELQILYNEGEEKSSVSFEGNSATVYEISDKFVVHEQQMDIQIRDFISVFNSYNEAAEHVIDIFGDEFQELIGEFFDENVKGCEYHGSFRPVHSICLDMDDFQLWERLDVSNNFINTGNDAKIFDNGYEGAYSQTFFVSEAVCDGNESQFFDDEERPDGWDDMDWEEKTQWIIECSALVESFEGWWDEKKDSLVKEAMENIKKYFAQCS